MAPSHVEDGSMTRKRHTAEEIVAKLRQVEVLTAQGRPVAEAIRSIGVTEVSSGTSCSTARSSTRSRRPRSSSRAGAGTTTRSGRTRRWATSRLHRKFSYGRPRYPGQLRRPPRPWRSDPSCTNSQPGPPNGGRPHGHAHRDIADHAGHLVMPIKVAEDGAAQGDPSAAANGLHDTPENQEADTLRCEADERAHYEDRKANQEHGPSA